jgi:hypothetical protein
MKKDLLVRQRWLLKRLMTYDSVDWVCLDGVMGKMAFPTLWRKWMRECVSTATASILVNGCPTEEFYLKRGLRQGNPLSPFFFF